jgi:S1-C subfamily serine protease
MRISITGSAILILTSAATASAQQQIEPQAGYVQEAPSPWVVTVIHSLSTAKMLDRIRSQPNVQVGVIGTAPPNTLNVTTGLVVDNEGHVVTRLVALDPNDANPDLAVATSDGNRLPAKLVGVDCATGFAVIKVDSLGVQPPGWAGSERVSDGFSVKLISMSLVRLSSPAQREIAVRPRVTVKDGTVGTGSAYSKLRGTYTLKSPRFLSRNDSSVVITPDGRVVGIAQFAGVNRAYLYPSEYIRDGIVRRVLLKNGTVPSGWLGVEVGSTLQTAATVHGVLVNKVMPDSPAARCGLQANDVIVGMDDFDVKGPGELSALLSSSPAGRKLKLRALRQAQPLLVEVELGERVCEYPRLILLNDLNEPLGESLDERLRKLQQAKVELEITLNSFQSVTGEWKHRDEAIAEVRIEMDKLDRERREIESQFQVSDNSSSLVYSFPAQFSASEIKAQLGQYFGIEGAALLVSDVVEGGAAQKAGLKAGDVLTGIRSKRLAPPQLRQLLLHQRGNVVLNVIRKSGSERVPTDVRLVWSRPQVTTAESHR